MITEIIMPKIGYTMEEGNIVKWLKQEGDRVDAGEAVLEISSDKATMEIEAPVGGILKKILAGEGDDVPVLQIIGYIGDPEDSISQDSINERGSSSESTEPKVAQPLPEQNPVLINNAKTERLSPRARKFIHENDISTEKIPSITGTGVNGLIVERDIKALLKDKKVISDDEIITPTMYKLITARRLTQSIQEVPQFTIGVDVDASALIKFRERLNEKAVNMKVSITNLLIKCVAKAIRDNMNVNVSWRDEKIAVLKNINIGFAVAADNGLVVPVINEPDKMGLLEITSRMKELADKARTGKLAPEEMSGGTFTVSNLGMFTVDSFRAIINPPESAILAVGRIVKKPVAADDEQIVVKPMMWLNLTSDHRVLDGADSARLIESIKLYMELPELLIL